MRIVEILRQIQSYLRFCPAQPFPAEGADAMCVRHGPGEAVGAAVGLRMQIGTRHERVREGSRYRPSASSAPVLLGKSDLQFIQKLHLENAKQFRQKNILFTLTRASSSALL